MSVIPVYPKVAIASFVHACEGEIKFDQGWSNGVSEAAVQSDQSDRRKALTAIFVAAFAAGLAIGAAMPMVAMTMELRGMSASNIGYVVAGAPFGLILTSPFIGTLVNRFGLLGSMFLGTLLIIATLLVMPSVFGVVPWVICRVIAGVGVATIWILSETWVNSLATNENRGRIIAGFMITMSCGFGLGPLVVTAIGVETWAPFYLAAGVICLSMIPLWLARDVAPELPQSQGWSFGMAIRAAPLLIVVALFAGVTDATQLSFYPVYAMREGFSADTALYMLTAIVLGTLLVQFPLGVLADRLGRNILIAVFLILTIVVGGLIPFVLHQPLILWPILVLWGGVAFGLYTLCIILLGDRFNASELAGANAALVALYEMGSVVGPVAVGHAMDIYGPNGMPMVLVLSGIPVVIFYVIRHFTRK